MNKKELAAGAILSFAAALLGYIGYLIPTDLWKCILILAAFPVGFVSIIFLCVWTLWALHIFFPDKFDNPF